jgi:hypothetical protein
LNWKGTYASASTYVLNDAVTYGSPAASYWAIGAVPINTPPSGNGTNNASWAFLASAGPAGPQGPPGPQGPQGAQGTPGTSGAGLPEAPADGQTYGRNGLATSWNSVLPIVGGTLTGPLVLSGNAAAALNPVTLQQVQTGYQPLDGDLTAISALLGIGYPSRTGSNTWALNPTIPWGSVSGAPVFITDAPSDSTAYGRLNTAWQKVPWFTAKGNVMLGIAEPASMSATTVADGGAIRGWYSTFNNYMSGMYFDGTSYRRLNGTIPPAQLSLTTAGYQFQIGAVGAADSTVVAPVLWTLTPLGTVIGTNVTPPGADATLAAWYSAGLSVSYGSTVGGNTYFGSGSAWKALATGFGWNLWQNPTGGAINLITYPSAAAGAAFATGSTWIFAQNGDFTSPGSVTAGAAVNAVNFYTTNGLFIKPASTSWGFYCDGSNNHIQNHTASWYDQWTSSNGMRSWFSNNGSIMTLDGAGDLTTAGFVSAASHIDTADYIQAQNYIATHSQFICNDGGGGLDSRGYYSISTAFAVTLVMGNANYQQCWIRLIHQPSQYAAFRLDMNGTFWDFRNDHSLVRDDGYTAAWNAPSDIRIKTNVAPSVVDALDIICRLPISQFDITAEAVNAMRTADMDGNREVATAPVHVDIGWVAQDVGAVLPQMEIVTVVGDTHDGAFPPDMHSVDALAVVPYLIRAMQQITARLATLEGAS